jgi:hypothetical protein
MPEAAFPPALGVPVVPADGVRVAPGVGVLVVPGAGVLVLPGAGVLVAPGAGVLVVPGAGVVDPPDPEPAGRAAPTYVPAPHPVRPTIVARASARRDLARDFSISFFIV